MWLKTDYIELPEQEKLCSRPNTSCSYIRKRVGLYKYERRLAVVTEDGQMVVYKYFLLGITAGLPLIGRVYDLTQLKDKKIRFEKKSIHIRLWTKDNKKITFRLNSPEEQILLPAFLDGYLGGSLGHMSHVRAPIATAAADESVTFDAFGH